MSKSIFIATNRDFRSIRGTGYYELRDQPNRKGPKELRLFEATREAGAPGGWNLRIVPDKVVLSDLRKAEMGHAWLKARKYGGSQLVAGELIRRLRMNGSNFLFFIHGYNNNVYDALNRAESISARYNVEVLLFSWPANGGGDRFFEDLHGKASYLSDKSDARASTEALDRALSRMYDLLSELNQGVFEEIRKEVEERYPDDLAARREEISRLLQERACPFKVSLLAHSMGNYLFKKMLLTSSERLSRNVVFDNVILKAADTNHANHAEWVGRIRARKRVYITINQDDSALALSNLKIGEQQKSRLGSTLREQDAPFATYIDLTHFLENEHSYFVEKDLKAGRPSEDLVRFTGFLEKAVNGEIAETGLPYHADSHTYRM